MSKIILSPNDTVEILFCGPDGSLSDGFLRVAHGNEEDNAYISVETSWPDNMGRVGVLYHEAWKSSPEDDDNRLTAGIGVEEYDVHGFIKSLEYIAGQLAIITATPGASAPDPDDRHGKTVRMVNEMIVHATADIEDMQPLS